MLFKPVYDSLACNTTNWEATIREDKNLRSLGICSITSAEFPSPSRWWRRQLPALKEIPLVTVSAAKSLVTGWLAGWLWPLGRSAQSHKVMEFFLLVGGPLSSDVTSLLWPVTSCETCPQVATSPPLKSTGLNAGIVLHVHVLYSSSCFVLFFSLVRVENAVYWSLYHLL